MVRTASQLRLGGGAGRPRKRMLMSAPAAKMEVARASGLQSCATLANGVQLPLVGFGTYRLKETEVQRAVLHAVHVGYRLIDTAHVYGGGKTEGCVGRALGLSIKGPAKVQEEKAPCQQTACETFVTTKVWR